MYITFWYNMLWSHFNTHATLNLCLCDAFRTKKLTDGLRRYYINAILIRVFGGDLGALNYFVLLVIWKPGRHQIEFVAAADDLNQAQRLKVDHRGLTGEKVANAEGDNLFIFCFLTLSVNSGFARGDGIVVRLFRLLL